MANSIYAPQLAWWLSLFPPEQLHIVSAEYLSGHVNEVASKLFSFLGLPEWSGLLGSKKVFPVEYPNLPPSQLPLYKASKYAKDLDKLYAYFEPYNQQLYKLLDAAGYTDFPKFPTSYSSSDLD